MVYLYFGLLALLGIGDFIRVLNRAYVASRGAVDIDIATPLTEGFVLSIVGLVCLVLASYAYRGRNGAQADGGGAARTLKDV